MQRKRYQLEREGWTREARPRIKPYDDPERALEEGCRYFAGSLEARRRMEKPFGEQAEVGPRMGPATPVVGTPRVKPITNDSLNSEQGARGKSNALEMQFVKCEDGRHR